MLEIYPRQSPAKQYALLFWWSIFSICIVAILILLVVPVGIMLVAIIGLMIATRWFVKQLIQPALSFSLTPTHIQHHTNKGGWSLNWQQISKVGIVEIGIDGWYQALPWVGFKLRDYQPLLDGISYRLASKLLIEQRALLLLGYRYAEPAPDNLIEDILFDETPYVAASGKIYHGLLAAFANRMRATRQLLGFDLFVSDELLDRPAEDFVGLTRRYLAEYSAKQNSWDQQDKG